MLWGAGGLTAGPLLLKSVFSIATHPSPPGTYRYSVSAVAWERLCVRHSSASMGGTPKGRSSRGATVPLSPCKSTFPKGLGTSNVNNVKPMCTPGNTNQHTYFAFVPSPPKMTGSTWCRTLGNPEFLKTACNFIRLHFECLPAPVWGAKVRLLTRIGPIMSVSFPPTSISTSCHRGGGGEAGVEWDLDPACSAISQS